jgi:hypothetical protein
MNEFTKAEVMYLMDVLGDRVGDIVPNYDGADVEDMSKEDKSELAFLHTMSDKFSDMWVKLTREEIAANK